MTDVNEELVRNYYELNGFLVRTNLTYLVKKEKSSGYSDIDLVIYNLETNEKAIVEVKGWHGKIFTPYNLDYYEKRVFGFVSSSALEAATKYFKTDDFKKYIVISELPKNEKKKKESLNIMKDKGIDEIIEFRDILESVVNLVIPNRYYRDSEFLQTIRLLKYYDFVKSS